MNILENIKSFFSMIDWRFSLATIIMIALFAGICYLVYILATSLRERRAAIRVELPDIDSHGEVTFDEPQFDDSQEITVELIDSNEDIVSGEEDSDDEEFLRTLSSETGKIVSVDEIADIDMPQVGEIDYNKIKEERMEEMMRVKREQEKSRQSHLIELAKADSEDDLASIVEVDNKESVKSRKVESKDND